MTTQSERKYAHTGCNCREDFHVTSLDLLDRLVNDARIEQPDASRLLWDHDTPIANQLAIEHAGNLARQQIRAGMYAAFPWLQEAI